MSRKITAKYFNREYWEDGTKSGYTTTNFPRESYLNEAIAVFYLKLFGNGGKFLEVGCAFGWVVDHLVNLGYDAYGFDISKWAIKNCPEEIKDRLQCHDGLKSKYYPENSFDFIGSFETAEHIAADDVPEWLGNLNFWLRSGGSMFLTVCVGDKDYRGLTDNDESHQTLRPRDWWNEQLTNAGFVLDLPLRDKAEKIEVQTDKMVVSEILMPHYGKHVFCATKE